MVYTSLYAFPGVYEGREKKYTTGVRRVMGGSADKLLFFRDGFP